ncbi:hypothetical protein GCM10009602_53220 [Nocardiopsis tropica]
MLLAPEMVAHAQMSRMLVREYQRPRRERLSGTNVAPAAEGGAASGRYGRQPLLRFQYTYAELDDRTTTGIRAFLVAYR